MLDQAVGTPKACFVCYKPTTTVLATINTVDFIYTCDNHLTDPGFATRIGESSDGASGGANKPTPSAEEIAKVKEEWEERQKRKQEKAKEKEKEKEQDKDKEKTDSASKEDKPKSAAPSQSTNSASTPTPAPSSSHQKYTLHRDIFSIRQAEHRKRRQAAHAKELLPRLPGAPRGGLSPN